MVVSSVRSSVICCIVLIAVVALVHEFASSKELTKLLRSTVEVEGSTSIRFKDNNNLNNGSSTTTTDGSPYPQEHFCVEWKKEDADNRTIQPVDDWFTHHVEYNVVSESDSEVCFERDAKSAKSIMHLKLYHNQFQTGCEAVHKRYLWSSGWGADFKNVLGGLEEALEEHHVPFIMSWNPVYPKGWHYAANKGDFSNKTCPEADLTCYFVPYHPCGKDNEITNNTVGDPNGDLDSPSNPKGLHTYQYVTRPLWWLRRAIFNYVQEQNLQLTMGQCSVIHVRRADVVMHGSNSRKYYPVKNYVDLLPQYAKDNHDIFLLTDDQNAISEAHEFFPDLKWRYIDRPRHNGTSGGWENQTPSRNPAGEVVTILGTFEMVKNCVHFVHGAGSFSDLIWTYMQIQSHHSVQQHFVDRGIPDAFAEHNTKSAEELKEQLDQLRAQKEGGGVVVEDEKSGEETPPEEEIEKVEEQTEEPPVEEEEQTEEVVEEEEVAEEQLEGEAVEGSQEEAAEDHVPAEVDAEQPEAVEEDQPAEEENQEEQDQPEQEAEQPEGEQQQPEADEPLTGDLNKLSVQDLKERLELARKKAEKDGQQAQRRRRLRVVEEDMVWPLGPTLETEMGR